MRPSCVGHCAPTASVDLATTKPTNATHTPGHPTTPQQPPHPATSRLRPRDVQNHRARTHTSRASVGRHRPRRGVHGGDQPLRPQLPHQGLELVEGAVLASSSVGRRAGGGVESGRAPGCEEGGQAFHREGRGGQ